jgi:phosphoglycolate phosphatase
MKRKCIITFDLDGVLLDSETNISWMQASIQKTLAYFHIPQTEENMQFLHFDNVKQFKKISRILGLNPSEFWPIRNNIYTIEKANAIKEHSIGPFKDVFHLFELRKRFDLGIISNSPQSIVDLFIQEFHFQELFTYPIGRGDTLWDIEHMKPHRFLFDQLKQKVSAEKWIYIGDRESDRVFAEKTGMGYIHLQRDGVKSQFTDLKTIVSYLLEDIKPSHE